MPRACSETLISDTIFEASWRTGLRARAGPPVRGGMVMSIDRRDHEISGTISSGASRSSGSSVPATYRSATSQKATALNSNYIDTASIGSRSSASLPATYRTSSDSQDLMPLIMGRNNSRSRRWAPTTAPSPLHYERPKFPMHSEDHDFRGLRGASSSVVD